MSSIDPPKGFVFIVTYGRSGSTLVQSVLQTIDGYTIRGENNNILLPFFDAYEQVCDAKQNLRSETIAASHPWYGFDAVDPEQFGAALKDMFLRQIIKPPEDARAIGFKEIRFHKAGEDRFEAYLDFIRHIFAPAKFIFNMRHWEVVAQSSWWATMDPVVVREKLETCDRLFRAYAAKHPTQCHMMQYEDYVDQPEKFAPLFQFLDEPFNLDGVKAVAARKLPH